MLTVEPAVFTALVYAPIAIAINDTHPKSTRVDLPLSV